MDQHGTKFPQKPSMTNLANLIIKTHKNNKLTEPFPLKKGETCMVETYRATSKINKQQSVKGSKTVTQVPE